jgi:photosystem II stability/assembly factor-like uncharacterized protein
VSTFAADSRLPAVRRIGVSIFLGLLSLPALVRGGTDWWSVVGPDRGTVLSLAIDPVSPNVLYMGGVGGVLKTLDGGAHWSLARNGLPATPVFALAIDPKTNTTLYAGTKGAGVYKTTNGGSSWAAAGTGLAATKVFALAVDPSTPSTVYAATAVGVFKSGNGASSWTAASSGLGARPVFALAIDPKSPSTIYAGTKNSGVFKSTDGAASWTAASVGLTQPTILFLAIDPKTPSTIYVGSAFGIFRSTDAATSWVPVLTLTCLALVIDPGTPSTIYAGTSPTEVFKSTDSGGSWLPVDSGLPLQPGCLAEQCFVDALAIDPLSPATLYAGTQSGVFKSTNGGGTWSGANSGLAALRVFAVAVDPSAPSTVYAGTDLGVFKSVNAAASWSRVTNGPGETPVYALLALPGPPATLLAGYDGGASMSTDGGSTWTAVPVGLATTLAFAVAPGTPSTVYAGGFSGTSPQTQGAVAQSTDGGLTWTGFGVSQGALPTVNALAVDPTSPTTVYAGTDAGGYKTIFDSVGNKLRWVTNSALTARVVFTVLLDPVSATTVYAGTDGGLFKSTDGGVSWTPVSGLPVPRVFSLTLDRASSTFYAGTNGGVFKSTDGGASWATMNQGLRNGGVSAVTVAPGSPGTLYAGTIGSSVFQLGLPRTCTATSEELCLAGGRFRVSVAWRAAKLHTSGAGQAMPLSADTGTFWFFQSTNVELVVKVLDARSFSGKFWVFYGALSDVEYTITVTDTVTGETKTYFNSQDNLASIADTSAFPLAGGLSSASEASLTQTTVARASGGLESPLAHRSARPEAATACVPGQTALCLSGGRFRVEVAWRAIKLGTSGSGQAVSLTADTGYFWFFQSTNVELIVKVLDARAFSGKFWVFYGALSDVEYTITVTDTATGAVKTYFNPQDKLASLADTSAF